MIPALALLILGYDIAYYAINVLVWAHLRESELDPVPLRHCIGIPFGEGGGTGKFMPPFKLGEGMAGLTALTARMLLGGEPFPPLLASAYDTGAGTVDRADLPPELSGQLDPDQTGVVPILPGEGVYGVPGYPVGPGIPGGVL